MAEYDPTPDAEQLETISPAEAQLRQNSGGYTASGQPAPLNAMVDTQGTPVPPSIAARRGTPTSADYTMSLLKGQPYGQVPPPQQQQQQTDGVSKTTSISGLKISPYEAEIPANPSPTALHNIARHVGIDTSQIDPSFWDQMSQHYKDASNPTTLGHLQQWVQASGLGHLMQGMDAGSPQETVGDNVLPAAAASTIQADKFFNEHIQSHIIDGSRYIDGNGNYKPPTAYKAGSILGSAISNPAAALQPQFAVELAAPVVKQAGAKLGQAINGTTAYMAAHPAVANVLKQTLKYSAIGYAINKLTGGRGFP